MGNKFSAAVAEQKEAKKRPSVIFHKKKHEQKAVTASNLSSSYHSDLNSKETTSGKSSATSSHTQPFEATTTSTIETPTLGKTPGEDDRMNANQFFIKALFGGNMMEPIAKGIDFNSSSVKVLDIGCGSGSWVMDMATEYPNSEFIGLDHVAFFPNDIRPANVTFIKHDALKGLPFEKESLDFVQIRLFALTFTRPNWDFTLKEAHRVLKPGGFIQIMEAQLLDEGDELITALATRVGALMEENNQDPLICFHLPKVIETAGFVPVAEEKKVMTFEGHPLSKECEYIIYLTIVACQSYVKYLFSLATDKEFEEWKGRYMESRKKSTVSTWFCAAGQKPTI